MAFCTNCGKELSSFTVVCPACGCEVQGRQAADSVRKFYVDITHAQTTKEKADLIKNGEFEKICNLTKEAKKLAKSIRP